MAYCAICNHSPCRCWDRPKYIPSDKIKYFKDEYTRARTDTTRIAKPASQPVLPTTNPDIGNQPHYASLSPQPIEVIEQWGLAFHPAQAIKYIARAGNKPGNTRESDIRKAIWYLKRWLGPGAQPLVVG